VPRALKVTVAFLLVALGAPGPARAARYTLEQLLAKVRTDYPGVQAARESVNSADAQVSQANRLWWPMGDVTFGITGSPIVRCTDVNGVQNPSQAAREANCFRTNVVDFRSGEEVLPIHGVALNLSINLIQPLYTSGKIESARAAARAGHDAAIGTVQREQADATLNAIRAYWGVKLARAADATLSEGVSKLGDWIKKITDSLESGKNDYTESDLARLKIASDNAALVLLDIRRNLAIALSGLRVLTGDPQADVDDSEIDVVEPLARPVSYYEDAALVNRPESKLLSAAADGARAWRRWKLAELLPDFGLAFSFTYGYASAIDNPANAFMSHPNALGMGLLLVVRQPLDLAMRLARLSQATADERAFAARRKQALGGIAWDIDSAYANAEEARARYERTGHAEKVARGWYRAMDDQIGQTAGIGRDIADAARNYFELRLRHLQAIMDVNVTTAALRRAAGVD
jgi:outer membrane protein TolC